MKLQIIAANNYACASKEIIDILKRSDPKDLDVKHIVISNDRCSMSSELEVLDALGGSFNVSVMTFARLTSSIMTEKPFISKQSAIMLIGKLAQDLKGEFKCFKRSFDTTGFAENVYETISQLKYSCIAPEDIVPSSFEEGLRLKMHDVKLLYEAYEDFIKDRYVDSGAKLQQLIKHIPESPLIKNAYFYIKDFDSFSMQELAIIRQLVIYSKGVTVAIPYVRDKAVYLAENFFSLKSVAEGLDIDPDVQFVRDNQPNFVADIEENLFAYKTKFVRKNDDCVKIEKHTDIFSETERIAQYILQKVHMGARFKDFLVVVGSTSQYAYAIDRVFGKYAVPYFLDSKMAASEHALSRFLLSVANAAEGNFRRNDCLDVMKSCFYGEKDVARFENFCLKHNFRFFGKPFDAPDEFNDEAEQMRAELVEFITGSGLGKSGSAEELAAAVTAFVERAEIKNALEQMAARQQTEDFAMFKATAQVLGKISTVAETLGGLFGKEIFSAKSFIDVLQTGLDAEKISLIPLYNDCVVVTTAGKARANGNKHLIVAGANEGAFPQVKGDARMISDADIDRLEKHGLHVTPKTESENRKEKFNVFQLLTAPRQSLFMSYLEGEKRAPCLAAEEISAMFLQKDDLSERTEPLHVFGKRHAHEKFAEAASKAADGQKQGLFAAGCLYHALGDDGAVKYVYDGAQKPRLRRANEMLLPRGTTSVTKLEKFYSCPYSYFLQNGLKLEPRDNGEMQPLDVGIVLHEVLEIFARTCLCDSPERPEEQAVLQISFDANEKYEREEIDESQVPRIALDIAERCLQKEEFARLRRDGATRFALQRLQKEAVAACLAVFRQAKESSFKPFRAEMAFGFGKDTAPPLEIASKNGKVRLNGKIDRIDVCGDDFIVIDYKTGNAGIDEKSVFTGQKLQLITYVKAAKQFLGKRCVGFFYLPVHDAFEKEDGHCTFVGRLLNDKETVFRLDHCAQRGGRSAVIGAEINSDGAISGKSAVGVDKDQLDVYERYSDHMIRSAVDELASGFIGRNPLEGACDRCAYASVCDFADLEGTDRKKPSVKKDDLAEVLKNV